ncbi:telomeric repeat-binding factor 2-interacting protein 1 [Cyanistes caeruleus]|uniref:telomeric repeat-binding factor 2-interacting protein 1 n=1 Tax=Cyanistes caeruleus TaxID=156563 RepID=UPI000CDACE23|nr:telomeric repeat-binding factor 2-interacting protein 1 [Cyanistes caeruleus]
MAGGQAGAARSRSLFLWDDGRPMRFYLRPGLAKLRLAPLVLAGGGRLCRVQEPGAVLLAQPGEVAPDGAVSTEYVTECVERNHDGAWWRRRAWARAPLKPGRRCPRVSAEPPQTEDPTQIRGLFAAASREFESTESESDSSDVAQLSTQDGVGRFPGETASDLKTGPEDSAFPDIQLQRQERPKAKSTVVGQVIKTMENFMEKFAVDLFTVTQAFLKNSGDVEATSYFLQTGQRLDGYPVWSREDDLELQKDDEHVRNKLIAKFGAENVAKRIVFRKS